MMRQPEPDEHEVPRQVVVSVPESKDSTRTEPWRATIASFDNEELFQEFLDALKEGRDSFRSIEETEA